MGVRVLLANSHSTNTGDAAIVAAMLDDLEGLGIEAITVHCSDPSWSLRLVGNRKAAFRKYLVEPFEASPGPMQCARLAPLLCLNIFSAFIYRVSGKKIFLCPDDYRKSLADLFDSDIIISVGGGFLHPEYGFFRPYYDFLLARILGKRTVIYAQSMGPFSGFWVRTISKLLLGSVDLIMLRDAKSMEHLEDLGVSSHLTADAAFGLRMREGKDSRMVVMCPRRWTYSARDSGPKYLGMLAMLGRRLSEEGARIVVIPTTPEDIAFHETLKPLMPQAEFVAEVQSPEQMSERLASSGFVISSRMHPIVLGSLCGTPFFALGWEYKAKELADTLCGPGFSESAELADGKTIDTIIKAWRQRKALRKRVGERTALVQKKAGENARLLAEHLEKWDAGTQ